MPSNRSPLLITNIIIIVAVVVGIVAGIGLRGETQPSSHNRSATIAPSVPAPQANAQDTHLPELDSASVPVEPAPFDVALQAADTPTTLPPTTDNSRGRIGLFSFADIVERVSPAVVTVTSTREVNAGDGIFDRFLGNRQHPSVKGHGSGFIIRSNGIILTNNHVVENADELTVRLQDGREFKAEIVGRDPQTDVAVLRIDATGLPTLHLGDSDRMRVGDWVLAVGSPFRKALETSVTAGIISGKGRGNVGIAEYEEFLQTDAAINPGNSGGPLINLEGDVIGINTAIATRNGGYQGVSFAIPMNFAKPIFEALLDNGKVRRAWLGVRIGDVTAEMAERLHRELPEGVAIVEVYDDMPADQAGIQKGDIVLSMDSKPTPNSSMFRNRVSLSRPGQRVELEILRNGNIDHVDVVLGELTDEVLAQVQDGGRPAPTPTSSSPDFGLELAELTSDRREEYDLSRKVEGVLITRVARGSQASEAGLEAGDVIYAVNRHEVESLREFTGAMRAVPSDRPILLNVKRGSESFFVTLDPAS